MKEVINVQVPSKVLDLIVSKSPLQAFEDMIKKNGIPVLELKTFGMVVTDIYNIETGATHHHVTYWENGQVSVTTHAKWAVLIAVEDWGRGSYPNGAESMVIFNRHVSDT